MTGRREVVGAASWGSLFLFPPPSQRVILSFSLSQQTANCCLQESDLSRSHCMRIEIDMLHFPKSEAVFLIVENYIS